MRDDELPFVLLAASNALVEAIDAQMREHGFDDLRPAHGFAFVRMSGGGCTLVELAEHLGMTKQSASTVVAELERKGYVARSPHPEDGRATLLRLTSRGVDATREATEAARTVVRRWKREVGATRVADAADALAPLARDGRVRPTW